MRAGAGTVLVKAVAVGGTVGWVWMGVLTTSPTWLAACFIGGLASAANWFLVDTECGT